MSVRIQIGSRVRLRGTEYEVASLDSNQIVGLCGPDLTITRWHLSKLMAQPGVEVRDPAGATTEPVPNGAAPTDAFIAEVLPPHHLKHIKALAADLREVLTGFRAEQVDLTGEEQPDPRYDLATTTLKDRVEAKAKERGCHVSTIWEKLKPFRESGGSLLVLVDRRYVRARTSWTKLDERVRAAMDAEVKELEFGSNVSKNTIRLRVQRRLDREHGPGAVKVPPKSTFNRRLDELGRGKGFFGRAKTRQGNARRPKTPYVSVSYERAGQLVIVDITPLDAFALDPLTGEWVNLDLLMALDACTRSIVALRLVPAGSKDVDAGMLVREVMLPKFAPKEWGEEARWRYWGIPEALLTNLAATSGPRAELAGIPLLRIEALTVDNAWVFGSLGLREGAKKHKIDLIPARLIQPTDKAPLERTYRTVAVALLEQLRGYKGPDVWSRGLHIEDQAVYFIDELEAILWEWVARVWQNRPHDSLRIHPILNRRLTPNEAFDLSLQKWGFLYVPAGEITYYDFLSVGWVKRIHHDGIRFNGHRYDDEDGALEPYRNERSPYGGLHPGEWPIRWDKRDPSRVFFMDPEDGSWHTLLSKFARRTGLQFTDVEYAFARALAWQDGSGRITEALIEARLNDIVTRAEDLADSAELRKIARRAIMQRAQLDHDRDRDGAGPSRPAAPPIAVTNGASAEDDANWDGPADWAPPELA